MRVRSALVSDPVNEAELRRKLDEVHRQMLDRDNAFRFHEREIEARDQQIEQLREELKRIRDWAGDLERWAGDLEGSVRRLEATIEQMEASIGWRAEMRIKSMLQAPRRLLRRGTRP